MLEVRIEIQLKKREIRVERLGTEGLANPLIKKAETKAKWQQLVCKSRGMEIMSRKATVTQ